MAEPPNRPEPFKGIVFLCLALPLAFVAVAAVLGAGVRAFLWAGGFDAR